MASLACARWLRIFTQHSLYTCYIHAVHMLTHADSGEGDLFDSSSHTALLGCGRLSASGVLKTCSGAWDPQSTFKCILGSKGPYTTATRTIA